MNGYPPSIAPVRGSYPSIGPRPYVNHHPSHPHIALLPSSTPWGIPPYSIVLVINLNIFIVFVEFYNRLFVFFVFFCNFAPEMNKTEIIAT